ncbi:MAG TPA: hypothetical protein VGJ91_10380 [Polyangiaceae bacterium]|jgi:hypothetical protein
MNRFLLGGCLIVLFGCGARTEYFMDEEGAGGLPQGAGGAPSPTAGAPQVGGAPNHAGAPAISGAPNATAGAPGIAGAPHFAGGTSVGGAPHFAGAPSVGGAPGIAGAPGVGGVPGVAGAPGIAGSGAVPGIIQACQVIAGNSCQQCLCKSCASQIVECFSNFGCALILACAQQSGCQGLGCYSASTCKPVIDKNGGLSGSAMSDVLSLLSCSVGSQNSCNCN